MQFVKSFERHSNPSELVFTLKNRPSITITIKLTPDHRIETIDNPHNMRFPYKVGQLLQRGYEIWACHNNYLVNGESTCPEEKIFGIKKSDIPKEHPLRLMYPSKFK